MAWGTPVVGARTGGLLDVIQPGESGWFFEPGNGANLAQIISEILQLDASYLEEQGKCARDLAKREFDVSLQASRYIMLYQKILARHQLNLLPNKALVKGMPSP